MQVAPNIRCFIFDLDGTLVFNEDANFEAYEAAFEKEGVTFTREDFMPHFTKGGSIEDMYRSHVESRGHTYDADMLERVKQTKVHEYQKRQHLIEQNHAIIGLLKALSPHYRTALATTAHKANAMSVIKTFNLEKHFDIMIFREDVTHKKPNPECHQIIAKHFNVQPAECMIFEDSKSGIAAAAAFGAHVCKVVR
jgi:HAD superfamily hydrolase (TIGR01509 family)